MEHNFEKNIICPYCEWEDLDSWEFDEDDGVVTCGNCGKEFNVSRNIEVSYCTNKIECPDNHDYKLSEYFISKRKYVKGDFISLPESEWKYFEINICSICDDKEYKEITKEEHENSQL